MMMSNILEIIDKNDLIEVLELQKVAFTEVAKLMKKYNLLPLQQTVTQIQEELEKGKILKYINEENRIIGSVRAYYDNHNICHIGKLIVHPDFQNKGIGKALMCEIERYFPLCCKFTLFTSKDTPNTFNIYNKIGYQAIGEKSMGGVNMIIMEKQK